ncbi:MAG: trimethylamine methyltransferase family protein [Deltaproteobacteria bacterium]|nr:trimethylamine methyltransferase family protein [Deltaproteobacteria bacterium]MBW2308373.1 trimethylamine methyltransferase family protein [Deltaproteobacteria bacterium]
MDVWNLRGGKLKYLTDDEIEEIHHRALDVLLQVGCFFEHTDARAILGKAGCMVDEMSGIVKFPPTLVEQALRQCPSGMLLAARNPAYDIYAEGDRVYFGTGTLSIKVVDLETGQIRMGTLQDCKDFARLVDALEYVHFFKGMIHPQDVNQKVAELYMVYAAYTNTTKHVSSLPYSPEGASDLVRMGQVVAGGAEAFKSRPTMLVNVLAVSPLQWSEANLGALMNMARMGAPMIIGSEPQAGTTGPCTLAGTLLLNVAETLAGIVLAQVIQPGIPVMYGNVSSIADMRSGLFASGAVELGVMNVAMNQMARYYGLPTYSTGGMSDSKLSDAQSGTEKALQALMVALGGGNFIHDAAGLFECCLTSSYEQYVIDNEMLGMVARALDGMRVTPETLAFDVIKAVGPRGNFLGQRHTLNHIRTEHFLPRIFNRQTREDWERDGALDVREVARQRAREILDSHQPEPLPEEVDKELRDIIHHAEQTYGR